MKKIKLLLLSIWSAFVSLISPVCIGFIYMDITGHGKGYGYDMGSESNVAVLFGIFELFIWIVALIPPLISLCNTLRQQRKVFILIPIIGFVVFFCIGVYIFGYGEFIELFKY